MGVKFIDNSSKVMSAFRKQCEMGMDAIGITAETYAKKDVPVDTGRLRNSIAHDADEKKAVIGTNVEYARKIEFVEMKHTNGKAHFLRDSATTHGDEYRKILETALKD